MKKILISTIKIKTDKHKAYPFLFGAEGETRTLAAVTHPTPLAGAPRHQLEYFCKLTGFTCQVVAPSRCFNNITK